MKRWEKNCICKILSLYEEEEEKVKIEEDHMVIPDLFTYECLCGAHFVIHGFRTDKLTVHRKTKPIVEDSRVKSRFLLSTFRRQDDYNSLAQNY